MRGAIPQDSTQTTYYHTGQIHIIVYRANICKCEIVKLVSVDISQLI